MIQKKQLQFYADKKNHYTNKLFTFQVDNETAAFRVMLRFAVCGNTFRFAAINLHIVIPSSTLNIEDSNLQSFVDYFNKAEYDKEPTLAQALNDYRLHYGY